MGNGYPGLNTSSPAIAPGTVYNDTTSSVTAQQRSQTQQQRTPLPLEPLTDFQKFIASTTGQVLPVYGADLFRNVPATFAPLDTAPVPADFVVGPEDVLRIRVWGQIDFQSNLRVDRTGNIYIPQVGSVHVAGLTFAELDSHLREAVSRVYENFDLNVDMGQIHSIQIYVSGQARRPGVYTISSLSTLVDAIFASGGPSVEGSLRHIELRRSGKVVTDFDLYALLIHGDKSKDEKLQPGDVIYIASLGAQTAVTGSVRNPAIFELREGETLADLLADAGGASAVAAESRISIERIDDHKARQAMEVDYSPTGLATKLTNGDLVRVYSILPVYQKTVMLRGNVANPGRFAWHPGMRVRDLIPDKDSLITQNYWWARARLGLPTPDFEPVPGFGQMHQPRDGYAVTLRRSPTEGLTTSELQEEQQRTGNNTQSQQQQQQQPYADQQIQNAAPVGSQLSNAQQPVQQLAMQGAWGAAQQNNGIERADRRSGNISLAEGQTLPTGRSIAGQRRTEVRILAPEIDWDYAVIERLDPKTFKTILVPFDLGELVLQHDESQNLELQANDVVTVFSEADVRVPIAQQTKLVKLDGEVVHAGTYTVQPGETLRQLVERAGGLTPNAYLYGSEFTRQSVRIVQQARIDEYVQQLSMQILRGNLAVSSSAVSSVQDQAAAVAAQSSEQQLIASLRQIRATGRIVLEFKPDNSGISSIPDISMEDGDHFIVPSQPSNINVVGAVYDENSFLFSSRRHVSSYLQMAGGPNQNADSSYAFVIRASGEVVSRRASNGPWGNDFKNLRVYAGDTIVVPEKTFRPTSLRTVLDFTQIISQLALSTFMFSVLPIP
uniref:Putative Polysaccharide export protein n=1 Tax=mine drainage metagenome TaxID=410659 RepID=E6QIF6_9ZZZZ